MNEYFDDVVEVELENFTSMYNGFVISMVTLGQNWN